MHRLLERQLKRYFGRDFNFENLDENLINLLKDISEAYINNEKERRFLENTITVNTEELNELLRERSSLLEYKTQENQDSINLLHQYKKAIDLSLIVSTTDSNGVIKYANDNFCKVSGFSKDELIGKTHSILKDNNNSIALYKSMWDTIKNKKIWYGTFSNINKNGEKYFVNSTILPLLDRNENIKEFISLSEDVTQQIVYQEELKSQKERIKTILNNQENIIVIVNEKDGLVEANKRFFEVFDFADLDDFRNKIKSIQYLFDIDKYFNENFNEFEWCKQFSKKEQLYKLSKSTMDNNQIFSVSCTEVLLDKNINYICSFTDITELEMAREKAEIAQRAKSTFLANMSHEIRTPLNAIIGFSDVLCESDIKNEDKENAQIISRSAKSLLNIINDVLDISKIESGKLDIVNEKFVFEIFLEHIVELFAIAAKEKDIDFLYCPDNNLPYSVLGDSTRLQQVVTNLLSNAIKFTPKKGEIIFSIDLLSLENDIAKIKFSIKDNGIGISEEQQNIIFNPFSQADDGISRKYGGTGLGLSICSDIIKLMNSEIKLDSKENMGSEFSFILDFNVVESKRKKSIFDDTFNFLFFTSNTECEIKDNIQEHIKKLGQVKQYDEDNKTSDILFCSGVENLEVVLPKYKKDNPNSFIIYIGYENSLDMKVKKYIDSFITLPIYGSKLFNVVSEKLNLNKKLIENSNIKSHKFEGNILIAEDNPNNQKLIEILLSKLGMNSTIVSNGLEAVEEYKKTKYDLILMDINMPIMDGIRAMKEIKSLEKDYYSVPIIALTANSIAGDKERYLEEGMDDYLSKPLEFEKLKEILKRYLNNSFYEELREQKVDFAKISQRLNIPSELSQILLSNFKNEINNELDELKKLINLFDKEFILKKIYNLKNSSLTLGLNMAVDVLDNMQFNLIDNKDELIKEFDKFSLIILYSCELKGEE